MTRVDPPLTPRQQPPRQPPLSPRRRARFGLLPAASWQRQPPTWPQASPAVIAAALARAVDRPTGNWHAVGASRSIRPGAPAGRTVAGVELVLWRDEHGRLRAGPGACPHLGAPLCRARVAGGRIVCHWHGMVLGGDDTPAWPSFPTHDDGVLAWVRVDAAGGEPPLPAPPLPTRPPLTASISAVATAVGGCESQDVLANRLDPWHGAWLHPYAFRRADVVRVPTDEDDRFVVEVAYRVAGRAAAAARAEFTAPTARSVVMRVVEGEGVGSVVETHATPLTAPGDPRPRTAVVEAVLATSDRPGFGVALTATPLLRPLLRRTAARLWRDDLAYAERRWRLRAQGRFPG